MAKDPAFLFYPGSATDQTQYMSRLEKGAYFDLIKGQKLYHGFTAVQLRKILGSDFDTVWPALELVLDFDGELYFIDWVRDSIEKRAAYSKKQSDRVSSRYRGNTTVLPKIESTNENAITVENGNETEAVENPKPGKRVAKVFTPPTLQEVQEYFYGMGYTMNSALKFHSFYAPSQWKDSNGKQIRDWKQKARGIWFRDENKDLARMEEIEKGTPEDPTQYPGYMEVMHKTPSYRKELVDVEGVKTWKYKGMATL